MRMHARRDRGQPALPRYSYPGRYMEKHLFCMQIALCETRRSNKAFRIRVILAIHSASTRQKWTHFSKTSDDRSQS